MKKFPGCNASRDLKTFTMKRWNLEASLCDMGVYEKLSLSAPLCRVLISDSAWDISSVELTGGVTAHGQPMTVDKCEVHVFLPPFFP